MAALHISISAEKLFALGSLNVTNSMLTSLIASGLLIAFAVAVHMSLKKTNRPTGLQNLAEMIVDALYNLVAGVTHSQKKTKDLFPLIATFFLFILVNNWLGLLPGAGTIGFYEKPEVGRTVAVSETQPLPTDKPQSQEDVGQLIESPEQINAQAAAEHEPVFVPYFRAGTADLNMTLALGLMSVVMIQFFGVKYQKLGYFTKFINFSSPIAFFVGILEIVSEFSRIISFAFRLFGNIFAGEVLLVVMSALTKVVAPMPFYGMEIFVGFIQSLVFAMLSVVLMNMATVGHGENH